MSFAPSYRWADAQQATPSFQVASQGTGSIDQIPVPAVLDSSIYTPSKSHGGGAGSPLTSSSSTAQRERASTPGTTSRRNNLTSPRATSTPRLRPLHEDLIERGKMYEHRKEAMREHALRKELSKCRDVPKVSPMARAIEREPNRIVRRLYNLAEEKEKIRDYKNQALEKEDSERLEGWFKPKLSSLGSRANNQTKAVRHQQWEQKKQERLAQHRRNTLLKELQHVRTAPEINPKSEILAARAREREGLGTLSHIEAMMERDREAQLKRWENEQRHLADEAPGTPRITSMAARMHAKTDIFDRLYAMTPPRYSSSKKEAPNPDDLVNDVTRPFQQYSPVITAEAVKRFSDGGLLDRQEAYLQKKRERLRKAHEDEDRRHNPHIDPMSARIAAALPETSETRLTNSLARSGGAGGGPQRFSSSMSQARATTPNPSLSRQNTSNSNAAGDQQQQQSKSSNSTSANDLAVYERAVVAEMRRQQRLQKAREEHRQKQLQDCTFQPETTGAAAKVVGPATTPLERMAQRSAEWAKKRDEKLNALRSQEDKKETDNLTFQPQIQHPHLDKYESPLYGGDGTPWGVSEYVQRQQEARRQKEEREGVHLAVNSGNISARPTPAPNTHHHQQHYEHHNNDNNQHLQNFTSPRAPQLGNHPAPNIPSLDPPVRPPNHDVTARAPQGHHHQDVNAYSSTASNIANQYMRQ